MSELDHLAEKSGEEDAPAGWRLWLRQAENLLVVFALAAMVVLLILESVLRRFQTGIPGTIAYVQHLTLVIGMLGGALAARDDRLLSISSLTVYLKGWAKTAARIYSAAVGGAIAFWLMMANYYFVRSTPADDILANDIPVWTVQALLPIGFLLIAGRILWHSSRQWRWRSVAAGLTVLLSVFFYAVWIDPDSPGDYLPAWLPLRETLIAHWPDIDPAGLRIPCLIMLFLAAVLGLPVFAILGGAALILFFAKDVELPVSVAVDHYRLVINPTFPTIPLFTLAGYFLAESGASKRLIRLFQALVGFFRGGPAIVTVLVCAFFTSFTGASGVTILALAALLMPVLLDAGYKERTALGLLTGSGSLGMLFPPCLPVILYAIIANQEIETMFAAGFLPGMLLVGMTGCYGVFKGKKDASARTAFDVREAGAAIWAAKWEILIPVVALAGIFGGFATPVEAAAITALYAFIVETVIYRDLKIFKDVPRVMAECGLLIGGVLLILGVAMGFTNFLVDAQVPLHAVEWVKASIHSKWLFLLCLNLLLIVVGCLMDVFSAVIVMVPLIVPMAKVFDVNEVHLGIIFLANLELGYITPPIGMNLFLSSYRFDKPMGQVCRAIVPILIVQIIGVLLITYVPQLTLWLPELLFGVTP